jgi:hypothetical protein
MPTAFGAWQALNLDRDDWGPAPFKSLLTGETACVVIDDFYSGAACSAIAENVQRLGLARSFTGENTVASYTGLAAMELADRKEDYLAAVAEANRDRCRLLGDQPDPLEAVMQLLCKAWPAGAGVATEGERPYFAGVIRIFRKAVHHTDSASRDLKGWSIAGIRSQLSWNLYLAIPERGGEVQIWNRQWRGEDERAYRYDRARKKGYSPEVVDGWRSVVVPPRIGRFVIFNALYYHTVLDVTGETPRLAMSSFVGVADDGNPLVLWS